MKPWQIYAVVGTFVALLMALAWLVEPMMVGTCIDVGCSARQP